MLRAVYGFDHCAITANPIVGKPLVPFVQGFGYQAAWINSGFLAVDSDGFLGGYAPGVEAHVAFDMTGHIPKGQTNFTIGFRLKTITAYAGACSLIAITYPGNPNVNNNFLMTLSKVATPWVPAVGAECYVEITYDIPSRTLTTLVDGISVSTVPPAAFGSTVIALLTAGTWLLDFRLTSVVNSRYAIRDLYILDNTPGDGMVGPLGAQRMYPVYPDVATGAGWVSSTGQALVDTLNVTLPSVANVASPLDKTPLQLSLNSTVPRGMKVNAVSLIMSATSNGVSVISNKIEVSQGAAVFPTQFLTIGTDPTYNKPIGLFTAAPDGGVWDTAKLDSLAVKLTPDTSV